ncbi:hypothetical protein M758_5G031800 [Ceratodon purpureus]|nr:hypothetical protein M758_5G031800 [Ceratodon purpureus]
MRRQSPWAHIHRRGADQGRRSHFGGWSSGCRGCLYGGRVEALDLCGTDSVERKPERGRWSQPEGGEVCWKPCELPEGWNQSSLPDAKQWDFAGEEEPRPP